MKSLILIILFSSIFVGFGCSLFSKSEKLYNHQSLYIGYLPNIDLVMGTYINSCSPDHDTLVLTGGYGLMFFLLTKDSSGKPVIIRGRWDYISLADHITSNGPGRLLMSPQGSSREWISTIGIKGVNEEQVQFVMDTPMMYEKAAHRLHRTWQEAQEDSRVETAFNSLGKPFVFVKSLHCDYGE